MKRILLSAGMLGLVFAAAGQSNDLFDIEGHLKKKTTESFWNKPTDTRVLPGQKAAPGASLSFTYLASGEKLYQLPVDNMPCVVPDMSQFNNMPNAAKVASVIGMGSIPNPAPRTKIK